MLNCRVEVDLLAGSQLEYTSQLNNELSASTSSLNTYKMSGFRGFFFSGGNADEQSGCWLDGSYKFFDSVKKYPGLVGNCLSSSDGTFTEPQSISISANAPITNLIFRFDGVAGEYATEIQIGNTIYHNYEYTFAVALPTNTLSQLTITFVKWSKPNSAVKILTLKFGISVTYDELAIEDLSYSTSIIGSTDILTFGILAQSGNLQVRDQGLLKALNHVNLLQKGVQVTVYLEDQKVAEFIVSGYTAEEMETMWDIELTDDVVSWENKQLEVLDYADRSLKQILDFLIPGLVYDDGLNLAPLRIPNSYINGCTYWQAVVKCCQVGLLRIYKHNGKIHARRII